MKKVLILILLFIVFLVTLLFDFNAGSLDISLKEQFFLLFGDNIDKSKTMVIMQIRLPRLITAVLIGIALPISGLLLQTLFVNPLAGPYIFGISSGASFGVAVLLLGLSLLGFSAVPTTFSIVVAAIIGAGIVLAIILLISLKISNSITILIIGVMLGSGIGAMVNLMKYFSAAPMLKKFVIWTMGSLESVQSEQLWYFAVLILVPAIATVFLSKFLDALYLGNDNAQTLGVNVRLIRLLIFIITGIMTGIATAFCGPIGFVGIIVPHISRFLFKTHKHFNLIFYSAIIGASMMLFSDGLSHSFGSYTLPINSITAVLGIPIVFWIIFRNNASQMN